MKKVASPSKGDLNCNLILVEDATNEAEQLHPASDSKMKWNEMNRALGHLCAHIG